MNKICLILLIALLKNKNSIWIAMFSLKLNAWYCSFILQLHFQNSEHKYIIKINYKIIRENLIINAMLDKYSIQINEIKILSCSINRARELYMIKTIYFPQFRKI